MPDIQIVELEVASDDQAEAARKLLAAAGDDRCHQVLSVTGGFRVPNDIAIAAGLVTPAKAKVAKAAAES